LRRGDVDIGIRRLRRVDPQERRAVAEDLVDSFDELAIAGLLGVGVAIARGACAPRARRRRSAALAVGLLAILARGSAAAAGATSAASRTPRAAALGRLRLALLGRGVLAGRSVVIALLTDEAIDQVSLAQTPEAVDAELVGDCVEVRQRARFELRAVEYCCHLSDSFCRMGGWRPAALVSAGHPC
jgi:hypothetical protein